MTQQMQLHCVNIGNQLNFQHQPNESIPLKKVESDPFNENPTHLLTASTVDRNLHLPCDPQLSGNNAKHFLRLLQRIHGIIHSLLSRVAESKSSRERVLLFSLSDCVPVIKPAPEECLLV